MNETRIQNPGLTVEAIAEVIAEFWWGCQGGEGADTPPPNDGDRNLAAALLASPALATLRAHERANALRDAADEIEAEAQRIDADKPYAMGHIADAYEDAAQIVRDRADRQEPQ